MTSYLTTKILNAKKNNKLAVIPFITAGYPSPQRFWEIVNELDACGADIIEIGVPFSDPVADGPIVAAASQKVLAFGVTLEKILHGLQSRKGQFKAGIVLMGYYNPFLQYGLERLAKDAKKAGVHGFIVPDLPFEEAALFKSHLRAEGIDLIPLVGVNTSKERMQLYAESSTGYVYLVSMLGTTGGLASFSQEAINAITRVKEVFTIPCALGFGLKEPSQLTPLPQKPDAAVFGSAFLDHIANNGAVKDFMDRWLV